MTCVFNCKGVDFYRSNLKCKALKPSNSISCLCTFCFQLLGMTESCKGTECIVNCSLLSNTTVFFTFQNTHHLKHEPGNIKKFMWVYSFKSKCQHFPQIDIKHVERIFTMVSGPIDHLSKCFGVRYIVLKLQSYVLLKQVWSVNVL